MSPELPFNKVLNTGVEYSGTHLSAKFNTSSTLTVRDDMELNTVQHQFKNMSIQHGRFSSKTLTER